MGHLVLEVQGNSLNGLGSWEEYVSTIYCEHEALELRQALCQFRRYGVLEVAGFRVRVVPDFFKHLHKTS